MSKLNTTQTAFHPKNWRRPPSTPASTASLPNPATAAEAEFRVLVQRNGANARWCAWIADRPEVVVEGDEAMAAFDAIIALQRDRLPDPYQLRVDDKLSRGGHIEVLLTGRPRERKPCPSCKGTGKYVGLSIVEPCDACQGAGHMPG